MSCTVVVCLFVIRKTYRVIDLAVDTSTTEASMRTGGRPAVTDHRSRSTEDVGKIFFPTPISTENMSLSPTVMDVIDVLSENLHEVWSVNKIDAGWTYGPSRDDTAKTTPCLTHYAELTDVDRNYDITLTVETIK